MDVCAPAAPFIADATLRSVKSASKAVFGDGAPKEEISTSSFGAPYTFPSEFEGWNS